MRILVFRSGAYGDNIIITPVIRHLHNQGHELIVVTSKRGMEVFPNNPHISKLIQWKEETPVEKMDENLKYLAKINKCEKTLNFCESIEVALSQHPRSPNYKLPKYERLARFNRNFYEYAFEHAGIDPFKEYGCIGHSTDAMLNNLKNIYLPELFFKDHEIDKARGYLKQGCFNVLLGISGSGNNKCWPWMQDFAYNVCDIFPEIHFITVGDEKCRLIEPEREGRITNLSGKIPMREAMALTKVVDLVISPDTGIIHAAGCWDTPKMILLGHTTHEMISKHFKNAYPLQADEKMSPCSPCSFLIYNMKLQCPLSDNSGAYCMEKGLPLERVFNHFKGVYASIQEKSRSGSR